MATQDTLNRTVYGRLFQGAHDELADTGPWDLVAAIYDKTYMPALVLAPGKQVSYEFALEQNTSQAVALPAEYDVARPLYVAVWCDLYGRVTFSSPTHGADKVVLLQGTDSTTAGTHAAFWTYQGDLTSLTVSVPTTAQGGATTTFRIFMYEIPDLEDFESYFDKQIGLGVSGDE